MIQIIIQMMVAVRATEVFCFDDFLPFLFGTEYADTEISVAHQWDKDANNLIYFLGGFTYDVNLTESTTSSKRAWIGRLHVNVKQWDVQSQARTHINWLKYFKVNTDIANIVSIQRWREVIWAVSENEFSTEFYLTSLNRDTGKTYYQYVIKENDCTTSSKLYVNGMILSNNHDSWYSSGKYIHLAYNYIGDNSNLGAYFGFFTYYNNNLFNLANGATLNTGSLSQGYFTYFTCPGHPCKITYLLDCGYGNPSIMSQYFLTGGVYTDSSGSIHYMIQLWQWQNNLKWTALLDQGKNYLTDADDYGIIEQMCYMPNQYVFALTQTSVYRLKYSGESSPTQFANHSPLGGDQIRQPKALYCKDFENVYAVIHEANNELIKIIHLVFIFDGATDNIFKYDLSSNNLFSSDFRIASAVYYARNGNSNPKNFLIFGNTKSLNLGDPWTAQQTFGFKQGFVYPFDKDQFDTCYDNNHFVTQNPTYSNNLNTAWSVTSISSVNGHGTTSQYNFCFADDLLADPSDWVPTWVVSDYSRELKNLLTENQCTYQPTILDPTDPVAMGRDISDIWGDDFPNFTYNCLNSSSFSMTSQKPNFLIETPVGDTCKNGETFYGQHYWTYTWVTHFDNGTVLHNEYPNITRASNNLGNSQTLKIDFEDDPSFKYIGNMTVYLTALLPKNFTKVVLSFTVDHQPHPCNQSVNNFVGISDQKEFSYYLYKYDLENGVEIEIPMDSGLKQNSSIDARYRGECYHKDYYQMFVQQWNETTEVNEWVRVNDSMLYQKGQIVKQKNEGENKLVMKQDQKIYGGTEWYKLIGNHTLKVEASNDLAFYAGQNYTAIYSLVISCKVIDVNLPVLKDQRYIIKSGKVIIEYPDNYVQIPKCMHNYTVTSRNKTISGRQLTDKIITFWHNTDANMFYWLLKTDEFEMEGQHQIYLEYRIEQGSNQTEAFINYKASFILTLENKQWPYDNKPPRYSKSFPDQVNLYLGETWSFDSGLPTNDTILVDFIVNTENSNWQDFITNKTNHETHRISLYANPTKKEHFGSFSLTVTLTDNGNDSPEPLDETLYYSTMKETSYQIYLQVLAKKEIMVPPPPPPPPETDTYQERLRECGRQCLPVMKLEEVTNMGEVKFAFHKEMIVPIGYKQWKGNNTYLNTTGLFQTWQPNASVPIDVWVIPGYLQSEEKLQLTWNVTEFEADHLTLQIDFKDPIYISMGDTKDMIKIFIKDNLKFVDQEHQFRVEDFEFQQVLKSQMILSKSSIEFAKNAENLGKGMNGAVIGNFILNTLLSGSLHYIWGMINCLQIDFHLIGINIKLPASVVILYSNMIAITQFKIMPEFLLKYSYFWNYFLPSEERKEAFAKRQLMEKSHEDSNIALLGYGSVLMIDNLETLFCIIELYLMCFIVYFVMKFLRKQCQKCERIYQKLGSFLFWNGLLRFFIECYLEYSIAAMVDLKSENLQTETLHDKVNYIYSILSVVFIVFYPFFILIFLSRQKEEDLLHSKSLRQVYGAIYEGCKLHRKQGISFYFMFTLRRLLFAFIIVYVEDYPCFQIIANLVLSVVMIIYIGKVSPWDAQFNNKLEQFNEVGCLMLQYHQIVFTDFYPDIVVKNGLVASSFKYTTFIIIAVNCFFIGLQFAKTQISTYRKHQIKKRNLVYHSQLRDMRSLGLTLGSVYNPSLTVDQQHRQDFVEEFRRIEKSHGLHIRQKDHFWPDTLNKEEEKYIERYYKRKNLKQKVVNVLQQMPEELTVVQEVEEESLQTSEMSLKTQEIEEQERIYERMQNGEEVKERLHPDFELFVKQMGKFRCQNHIRSANRENAGNMIAEHILSKKTQPLQSQLIQEQISSSNDEDRANSSELMENLEIMEQKFRDEKSRVKKRNEELKEILRYWNPQYRKKIK